MSGIEHGTYAGYQKEKRCGIEPCAPCREANRIYTTAWRKRPGNTEQVNRENTIRSRALWRLADAHRDEFAALVVEERRKDRKKASR